MRNNLRLYYTPASHPSLSPQRLDSRMPSVTTREPTIHRRRLLHSAGAMAAWFAVGCDRQASLQQEATSQPDPSRPTVPLRVLLVGAPQDVETLQRGWESVSEQRLEITLIELDRSRPGGLAERVLANANKTDLMIMPINMAAEAIHRDLVVPLSADEFAQADESLGAVVAAARNAAARYAGETYAIPLGADQPFLLSGEALETVDSWQAYDRLVESWEGLAGEPTAPGWAGSMFLWRSASERSWLFSRDDLQPIVDTPPYVHSLEQMVQTCSRYRAKSQTPEQVWQGVADASFRGGIGFPGTGSEIGGVVAIGQLPGTTDASRVLLDPFSPVITIAASCRQTALAKHLMVWLSGGEGSQSVRRQVRGMNTIRSQDLAGTDAVASNLSNYERQLLNRLKSPVTMPTLQLLSAGEYYSVLDQQVVRAIEGKVSPGEALAEVSRQWQSITERVGRDEQQRVWRRAQGMRA